MNSGHIQSSLHNLTQVNRIQQGENSTPVVNQQIVAEGEMEKGRKKITTPTEPEETQDKSVDTKYRNREYSNKQKKRKKRHSFTKKHNRSTETGRFIDYRI